MKCLRNILPLLFFFALSSGAKDLKVFGVGNSLTDGLRWKPIWSGAKTGGFFDYVNSSGHNTFSGKTAVVAGAPLSWIWNEPSATNLYQPLTNAGWDVLTLQPYTRMLYHAEAAANSYDWGDVTNAVNFIQFALRSNPDIQVYVYSHWTDLPNYERIEYYMATKTNPATGSLYTLEEAQAVRQQALAAFNFDAVWNTPYTNWNKSAKCRTRSYFEQLTAELDKQQIALAHPVRLIPVGDVMYALNEKMRRGEVPGFNDIEEVFQDSTHLRPGVGRLIMAATWYATLFQESPEGLDYTQYNGADTNAVFKLYGDLDNDYYIAVTPEFASAVHSTAWEVVSSHPYAGVAEQDFDRDDLPNRWERSYFGGSTNASPSGDGDMDGNSNLTEYIAGLCPTNADSFRLQTNGNALEWPAVSGRVYDVYFTTNLMSGFEMLQSFDRPAGGITNIATGFYRVNVRLP